MMKTVIVSCCIIINATFVSSGINSDEIHIDCAGVFERMIMRWNGFMPVISEVHVCGNATENAYCESDGTIVVTEGMMKLFENEDELAAVVAHEMGHLIAKHKGRQTPEKEMEADRIGLELMVKAGYDPNAAVKFWTRYYERIGWWEGDGTHQEPHERVETLGRLASGYRAELTMQSNKESSND